MKETKKLLMTIYVAGIVLALVVVCLFETNVLEAGLLATDKQSEFLMTTLMELMTMGCAFLGLRLFKFEKVNQELTDNKAAYKKWGVIRLMILLMPLLADTLLYYIYLNPTFGYLGIMLVLCLPFVYPSDEA